MKIRLSNHLKLKVKVRKINKSLPLKIIQEFDKIYFDNKTKHWIAVKENQYAGKKATHDSSFR